MVVDVLGLILGCYVSAANAADSKAAPAVLVPVLELYSRLGKVLADQAYKGELDSYLQTAYECVSEIAPPRDKERLSCQVIEMDCRTDLCLVRQRPSIMSRLRSVTGKS